MVGWEEQGQILPMVEQRVTALFLQGSEQGWIPLPCGAVPGSSRVPQPRCQHQPGPCAGVSLPVHPAAVGTTYRHPRSTRWPLRALPVHAALWKSFVFPSCSCRNWKLFYCYLLPFEGKAFFFPVVPDKPITWAVDGAEVAHGITPRALCCTGQGDGEYLGVLLQMPRAAAEGTTLMHLGSIGHIHPHEDPPFPEPPSPPRPPRVPLCKCTD